MHFSVHIAMAEDELIAVSQSLVSLVSTRNDVVHHLAALFSLNAVEGCRQAYEYLSRFSQKLNEHRQRLEGWAAAHDEVRPKAVQLVQTAAFTDMLFDGIFPDGSVNWSDAGIVRALRNAAISQSEGGWTALNDALVWMRREEPTQIPSRYRCTTYRQVIHESRAFDVRFEPVTDGAAVFQYRPKV